MKQADGKDRKARLLEQGLFALLLLSMGVAGYLYEYYRTEVPRIWLVPAILAYQGGCYLMYRFALKAMLGKAS